MGFMMHVDVIRMGRFFNRLFNYELSTFYVK